MLLKAIFPVGWHSLENRLIVCRWLYALTIVASLAPANAIAESQQVQGLPRIVDGDTVQIGETKIRLHGIDAPETDQVCLDINGKVWTCGIHARDQLVQKSNLREWKCRLIGKDRYGRSLGDCEVGGEDIQRWMVQAGLALSFVRYSHTYDSTEAAARGSKNGLWAGAFVAPWDWRSRNKRTTILGAISVPVDAQGKLLPTKMPNSAVSPDCTIKGNVNRKGECIYHLPNSRFYDLVRMDLSRGKRWFCAAAEAEAAGCRPPK